MIVDIVCLCIEYVRKGKSWVMYNKACFETSSQMIQSMVCNQVNFRNLGGKAETFYKHIRKFGKVVDGIDCISVCGNTRRLYLFDYSKAKILEC